MLLKKDAVKRLEVTSNTEYTVLSSSRDVTFGHVGAALLQRLVLPVEGITDRRARFCMCMAISETFIIPVKTYKLGFAKYRHKISKMA